MKLKAFLILLILFNVSSFAQIKDIETDITGNGIFDLSILKIYPDSFPVVEVIFQAKNQFGKPLWLLDKGDMKVSENGVDCEVLEIKNITKNTPLNIGIVLDHSGSMLEPNNLNENDLGKIYEMIWNNKSIPMSYRIPINFAKKGILNFLGDGNSCKDSVMLISFSTEVDYYVPMTIEFGKMKRILRRISPTESTAFFDGLNKAIISFKKSPAKPVIIALTDGIDNSSKTTKSNIIKAALQKEIPIYIIGLGEVNDKLLKSICDSTGGMYYQTDNPDQLVSIYLNIKEQLKSIYELTYTSNLDHFEDEKISLRFSFINDTLTFSNDSAFYNLPEQAISYLNEKEKKKIEQTKQEEERSKSNHTNIGLYSAIGASILLISAFSFIAYYRKRKSKPKLIKIYPNPFESQVNVEYKLSPSDLDATLMVFNIHGQLIEQYSLDINENNISVDTGKWKKYIYLFQIKSKKGDSNAIKGLKK